MDDFKKRCILEEFITEREMMVAANLDRMATDGCISYDESSFENVRSSIFELGQGSRIPEPPECKIYRFQYYSNGKWLNAIVEKVCGLWRYSSNDATGYSQVDCGAFFKSLSCNSPIEKFVWIDYCDELGVWEGV